MRKISAHRIYMVVIGCLLMLATCSLIYMLILTANLGKQRKEKSQGKKHGALSSSVVDKAVAFTSLTKMAQSLETVLASSVLPKITTSRSNLLGSLFASSSQSTIQMPLVTTSTAMT
jgi:hypothetical protein